MKESEKDIFSDLMENYFLKKIIDLRISEHDEKSLHDVIERSLSLFIDTPFILSASLFMLDEDTYEFYHSSTKINNSFKNKTLNRNYISRSFQSLILSGKLGKSLNDNEIVFCSTLNNESDDFNGFIIPLVTHKNVLGVLLLLTKRPMGDFPENFYTCISLLSDKMAYLIYNINTINQLNTEKSILHQQIASRTKHITELQRDLLTIFNSVKTGIAIVNKESNHIVKINKAALTLMNYEESIVLNTNYENYLEKFEETFCTLSSNDECNFESYILSSDNKRIPILRNRAEIYFSGSNHFLESFTDLTKQKSIEHDLKINESRLKLALEATRNSIWDLNVIDNQFYFSPFLMKMLDYSEDDINFDFKLLTELMHKDDIIIFKEKLDNCIQKKEKSFHHEFRIKNKHGDWLWFLVKGSPVDWDNDKKPTRIIGIFQDINNQKQTEIIQSALYQISESVNITQDLDNLLANIHNIIQNLMEAKNFFIAIYNFDCDLISFPYFVDQFDPKPNPIKPGNTLTSLVIRTGEPLLADPDKAQKLYEEKKIDKIGALSIDWLGVPLKKNNKAFGALVVQSYNQKTRYNKEHLKLLSFVSEQVANAIQRKQAQDELNNALSETKKAYQKLENTQAELIKIEQKNTALAMAVTANHEINQPLMIIKGNRDLLAQKLSQASEGHQYLNKYLDGIDLSIERIEKILERFKNIEDLTFKDYSEGTDMVDI